MKEISQAYPIPLLNASVSSQLISTPSRLLVPTKTPRSVAHFTGSTPCDVGNYVEPKALMRTFLPLELYLFLRNFWTSSFELPKGLSAPKNFKGSAHTDAASIAPLSQVQKVKTMWLYWLGAAYPGTPSDAAIFSGGHQLSILLT